MSATATIMSSEDEAALDRWTDDQESALLRAVINWKPVGIHKHFRMVNIREHMLASGVVNEDDEHTSTNGIWKKLGTLYDLDRLDEREDSVMSDGQDEKGKTVPYWREFELPREEFEDLMWQQRLAPEGTSSPEMSRRESTVADTDEPRSSPIPGKGTGRGGRGSARKSGRLSKLQNEVETARSSRRTSKAGSTTGAGEDQEMEDVEGEEEGDGSDENEEDDAEEEEKKGGGRRGGRGGARARAGRRGRRRG